MKPVLPWPAVLVRAKFLMVGILRGADLMKRDQGASGLPLAVVALPGEEVENLNAVKRLMHENGQPCFDIMPVKVQFSHCTFVERVSE